MLRNAARSGFFILTVLIAWAFELVYGLSCAGLPGGLRIFAILWFCSGAAFFVGTIAGFLFGIPKSRPLATAPGSAPLASYRDNTNLEEVSDWLTKLMIGIGLVEMDKIAFFVGQCGQALGKAIDPSGQLGGSAIATGSIIVGFATGFLHYYMWARVIVAEIFLRLQDRSG